MRRGARAVVAVEHGTSISIASSKFTGVGVSIQGSGNVASLAR